MKSALWYWSTFNYLGSGNDVLRKPFVHYSFLYQSFLAPSWLYFSLISLFALSGPCGLYFPLFGSFDSPHSHFSILVFIFYFAFHLYFASHNQTLPFFFPCSLGLHFLKVFLMTRSLPSFLPCPLSFAFSFVAPWDQKPFILPSVLTANIECRSCLSPVFLGDVDNPHLCSRSLFITFPCFLYLS